MKQEANTIILDINQTKSKDIRDLRKGQGKIFKKISKMLEQLKAAGQTPPDAQPIILIVKKKSKSKGFFR